jgi:hypothetical protein
MRTQIDYTLETPEILENRKINERAARWDAAVDAGAGIGWLLLGAGLMMAEGGGWIILGIIALLAFRIFLYWWLYERRR